LPFKVLNSSSVRFIFYPFLVVIEAEVFSEEIEARGPLAVVPTVFSPFIAVANVLFP